MKSKKTLEYKEAIEYAKRLVKHVIYEMEANENVRTIMCNVYDKNDEYCELANKQLDVWAEWLYPAPEDE